MEDLEVRNDGLVEITNLSPDQPHRFTPPWSQDTRYSWLAGETMAVPMEVAQAILEAHEGTKFMRGRPPKVEAGSPAADVYETRQMTAGKRK